MSTQAYANISQRAVDAFRRTLAASPEPTGEPQRAMRQFLAGLYDCLFERPEGFGLPVGPDLSIAEDEPDEKERKQAVQQKIKKAHDSILQGLDFLRLAGLRGRLEGQALRVDDPEALRGDAGISKKFFEGLPSAGLQVDSGGALIWKGSQNVGVGLQALAQACENEMDERRRIFLFARCDFRAAPGYTPDARELYHAFDPADAALAIQLHNFFIERGFKTELETGGAYSWVVKYQGDRKIKGSAFFQIQFENRYAANMRLDLKCASTNRIAPLLAAQPDWLQDDYAARVFRCNGERCDWCRERKNLGPSLLIHRGEERVVCWFSDSRIRARDESVLDLVRQYADMHEQLGAEN